MLPKSQRIYHAELFPMPWNRMQITLLQILNLMKLHTLPSIVWKKVLYLVIFHFPFLVFTMSQMHCLPLHWEENLVFPWNLSRKVSCILEEQTVVSSIKEKWEALPLLMTMHIIRQRLPQHCALQKTIHIRQSGVYSSLIPIPEQKH